LKRIAGELGNLGSRTKILGMRVGELNAALSEINTFPEELSKISTVA
jgi:hypothetical protein